MASRNAKNQALRQAEARHATFRRRALVTGGATTALALAAGIGIGLGAGGGTAGAAGAKLVIPANATGGDGTVITYGKKDAPDTVQVYEDMRCPYCAVFERGLGPTLTALADSGDVKVEFHLAAFLDKSLGGKGSKTSLAALGAALNEGTEKFKAYHDVLFKAQPEDEKDDTFGSTKTLLDLADQVPGLRTASFNKAVKEGTYLPWAAKVADAFYDSDVSGTPTVKAGDEKLSVIGADGKAVSAESFKKQIEQATAR